MKLFGCSLLSVAFTIGPFLGSGYSQADEADGLGEPPARVKAYVEEWKRQREKRLRLAREGRDSNLQRMQKELRLGNRSIASSAKDTANTFARRVKAIEDAGIHYAPHLFPPLSKGRAGLVESARVIQVVDGKNLLAKATFRTDDFDTREYTVWIEGIGTGNLVDNSLLKMDRPYEVAGTKRYEALLGTKTVYLLRPFDVSAAEPFLKAALDDAGKPAPEATAEEKREAAKLLARAKRLIRTNRQRALEILSEVVEKYPGTRAAERARELLSQR